MRDVNFLPIRDALFADDVVNVYFDKRQLDDFPKGAIDSTGRRDFEAKQKENNWAQNIIEGFFKAQHRGPIRLADIEHPLRFGGSALTILDIESGPRRGRYWVGTARYTNRGVGAGKTGPDVGKLKNAGGVPSTKGDHLDPTAIGVKEGVEEIAFCCTSVNEVDVLCPQGLDNTHAQALKESIDRLNRGFPRVSANKSFRLRESMSYRIDTFQDTGLSLNIHVDGVPVKEFSNVVLSWTPRYSALEVAGNVFTLRINDETLAGILTADGPDAPRDRFAEDVYVVKLEEFNDRRVGDPLAGYRLNTTRFPNWPPEGSAVEIPYRPADGLQDLLDAAVDSFASSSRSQGHGAADSCYRRSDRLTSACSRRRPVRS